jgi:hypothetical protein
MAQLLPSPTARSSLRAAPPFPISKRVVRGCVKPSKPADALFEQARLHGLGSIERSQRSGHLVRVIGEVAESVAEIVLAEQGYDLFWQITTPRVHGVDLLFLSPDACVLALRGERNPAARHDSTPYAFAPTTDEPRVAQRPCQPGDGRLVARSR